MKNEFSATSNLANDRPSVKDTLLEKYRTNVNYELDVGNTHEAVVDDNITSNKDGIKTIDSQASVKSTSRTKLANKLQLFEIQKLIDEHKRESVEYTIILSSILRQIAFTEGSLFWFFKIQFQVNIVSIILGFSALLLFFMSDAVQYYNGYTKFKKQAAIFEKNMANKMVNETDYQDPHGLHLSITLPFKIKLIFLLIATTALVIDFVGCLQSLKIF